MTPKTSIQYSNFARPRLKTFCVFFLLMVSMDILAQKPEAKSKKQKPGSYDSTYMYKYNSALSIGPTLCFRNFNIVLYPKVPVDSVYVQNLKWRSPSNRFWGFDFNYDKFGFTMSIASTAPKSDREKKGNSSSESFTFSYGGNRCFTEFSSMHFKGFYEANSALTDTTLDKYHQSPDLSSYLFNLKVLYNTNHRKFAFKSSYGGLYRQLRSSATLLFGGNLHFNNITTDSSIVPDPDNHYFDNALKVKAVNCVGSSMLAGGAVNFVIRHNYFFNVSWIFGPDIQTLAMVTNDDVVVSRNYVSFAHDFRFATGFNTKLWYLTFTWKHESNRFSNDLLNTAIRLNSVSMNLGYRFNFKTPKLYQRFKNTRVYNAF